MELPAVWLGAVWLAPDVVDELLPPLVAVWTGPAEDCSCAVLVKFTGGIAEDKTDVLVASVDVELDIVGTPDVRMPGADWLGAVWVGLNDRLKPTELEVGEVEALVLLAVDEMLVMTGVVMTGVGIPVSVRLTEDDEDEVLKGPAEPVVRTVEPYETIVTTLAEPVDELPVDELSEDEPETVNSYPDDVELVELVLLPVVPDEGELTD